MLFPGKVRVIDLNLRRKKRKEYAVLPARVRTGSVRERAFSGISASMTLEAACVLPVFLFAMLAVMQFFKVVMVSSAVLAGMQDTAKDMAAYAYIRQLGVGAQEGIAAELITGGLSAVYAKGSVEKKASFDADDGTLHFFKSSFMKKEIIDLAVTYNVKNTYTLLPVPRIKTALRARVRAWTGRDGNGRAAQDEEDGAQQSNLVWVTETGTVYHKDPNCTHLKLTIQRVDMSELSSLRNKSGGKYHKCDRCHGSSSTVYITNYGNKYHTSAGCSGLKRTVRQVEISEVEHWRACSKCGGSG